MGMFDRLILSIPVAATQTITAGDWIELDSSGHAIKCATDESVKVLGLAETDVDTTAVGYVAGAAVLGVRTGVGIEEVASLVEPSGSGYDSAIVPGEPVAIGGSTGTGAGQHVVALDGTDTITYGRGVVGIALEGNTNPGGATPADSIVTIKIKLNVI